MPQPTLWWTRTNSAGLVRTATTVTARSQSAPLCDQLSRLLGPRKATDRLSDGRSFRSVDGVYDRSGSILDVQTAIRFPLGGPPAGGAPLDPWAAGLSSTPTEPAQHTVISESIQLSRLRQGPPTAAATSPCPSPPSPTASTPPHQSSPCSVGARSSLAFMVVEIVGGLFADSLSLLADAGHMVTDAASLTLALGAAWLAATPATPQRSFGLRRAEILAALANGVALVAISIWIIIAAIGRLQDPPDTLGGWMVAVGAIGIGVNLAAAAVTAGGRHGSLNVRAASCTSSPTCSARSAWSSPA